MPQVGSISITLDKLRQIVLGAKRSRLLYSVQPHGGHQTMDMNVVMRALFLQINSGNTYDLTCEICGCTMIERSCKIKCPNCGFTRDCSDP